MKYFYSVRNNKNEIINGEINASSIADAAIKLENKGFVILAINEAETKSYYNNNDYFETNSTAVEFSIQEKKEFFNSLYHLYSSGVPIVETFRLIINSSSNPNIKNFCRLIVKKTEKGKSLKDSLKNSTGYLGLAYTMLIAAGEEAGKLPETVEGIIKNLNKQDEIKSNLISALTYPTAIFTLALAVGMLFKFFILKVFEQMGSGNICIKSLIITAIIKMAIVFGALIGAAIYVYKNKELAAKIRGLLAKLFIFKNLINNYYFATYFYVMALSYEAGVPVTEGIVMSNSVVNIPEYKNKLKKAAKMLLDGCRVATALSATGLFTGYAMSQVSAGEQAGELDKMFKIVAFDYEKRLNTAIDVLIKLLQPTVMILVGLFVLYIAVKGYSSYIKGITSMF